MTDDGADAHEPDSAAARGAECDASDDPVIRRLKLLQRVADLTAQRNAAATESDDPQPVPQTPVDVVVDLLGKRMVAEPDRARLGRALDTANAPDTSRAGADTALGRAIGRVI